jgi:hypothetical protein
MARRTRSLQNRSRSEPLTHTPWRVDGTFDTYVVDVSRLHILADE